MYPKAAANCFEAPCRLPAIAGMIRGRRPRHPDCRSCRLYPNLFVCTVCRLRGRHAVVVVPYDRRTHPHRRARRLGAPVQNYQPCTNLPFMSLRDPNGVVAIPCRNHRLRTNPFPCTVCRFADFLIILYLKFGRFSNFRNRQVFCCLPAENNKWAIKPPPVIDFHHSLT